MSEADSGGGSAIVMGMFNSIAQFIRNLYGGDGAITLHEPAFLGRERELLASCIDTGFVSSVGAYVDQFEREIAGYTGAKFAVSTVNGTAALHAAMVMAGVKPGDEVVSQALTFVATANAIAYCGAKPVFLDVERENLGLSAKALRAFFETECVRESGGLKNKRTGRRIAACVPVHVFGHPLEIETVVSLCAEFGIPLVEDAAEGLGSLHKGKHLGTFGRMGTLSFNGNKILTTGGGGMILTDDPDLAKKLKHVTTTARTPSVEYIHDMVGFNYRMPNVNAALGCAQFENLERVLKNKIETAGKYAEFFETQRIPFIKEPAGARSNYWLNAILLKDRKERDEFLAFTAERKIFARPSWRQMNLLPMFSDCQTGSLTVTNEICDRLVNIPSSYRHQSAMAGR